MKILKLIEKICLWILVGFFLLMTLGSMSTAITGILMLFIAVALMPIKPITNLWEKVPAWKAIKPVSLFVVFCIAIVAFKPVETSGGTATNEEVLSQDMADSGLNIDDLQQEEIEIQRASAEKTVNPVEERKVVATPEKSTDKPTIVPTKKTEIAQTIASKEEKDVIEKNVPSPQPIKTSVTESVVNQSSLLEVHFINVGQGDATLIKCGKNAMLIDGGDNSKGTAVQNYLIKQGIDSLDYVIATHPDADHIGGLEVIVYKFDCGKIFMPDVEKDTEIYQELMDTMENRGYQKTVTTVGDTYSIGSASFQIISPALTYSETNNNSIVIRLTHGENSFLFTGDAEVQAQQEMTYGGLKIKSDVMKIPHHGGTSGYQKWFYNEVKPTYAVISCGKDNSYGHPHKEVLDALKELGVSVYRTDEQGNVVATSDGTNITWSTTPSVTWEAGRITGNVVVATGATNRSGTGANSKCGTVPKGEIFIGNKNNQKLHKATCSGLPQSQNQVIFDTLENASAAGYTADNQCQKCMPYGIVTREETKNQQVSNEPTRGITEQNQTPSVNYIGNANNQKLHKETCKKGPTPQNQVLFSSLEEAEAAGYTRDNQCKICYPYGK